ncbi:MAG: orotidine-5'-phosphate decarboxylase [Candidatus Puniceispirillaceae bacterium]
MSGFGARLYLKILSSGTPLCVGIDPHPDIMPKLCGGANQDLRTQEAADNLERFCTLMLDGISGQVGIIKPQVAFFEAYGGRGLDILQSVSAQARKAGMLVIMDAKRGDIGSTAKAYARAWLGHDSFFGADALTVNPYLGADSIAPFCEQALDTESGLFVLARTSNKGSADIQALKSSETPVWAHVANMLTPFIEADSKGELMSSIGVVIGATNPEDATHLREILPTAPFLVPGYGAQGASAADALAGLYLQHLDFPGGVINASRAISHNEAVQNAENAEDFIAAITKATQAAKADIAAAIKGM